MARLTHRDMTHRERSLLERRILAQRAQEVGLLTRILAVLGLLGGSFAAGLLLFGLPAAGLVEGQAGTRTLDLAFFGPGLVTLLLGGTWSVVYYLRGSWRVRRELLDDLDYGRVEIVDGVAQEAWTVDGPEGPTWLLDLGHYVLLLSPSAVPEAAPRTFPGRRVHLVRLKHSGIILELELDGPALAPTGRLRAGDVSPPEHLESARYEGALEEVCTQRLAA